MKKSLFSFIMLMVAWGTVSADVEHYECDFRHDGIPYSIVNSTEVVACDDYDRPTESGNIPEKVTFNGRTFTVIGLSEFCNHSENIQQITLPGSIIFVKGSFRECESLKSLVLPSSVISFACYNYDHEDHYLNLEMLKLESANPPYTTPESFLESHYQNTTLLVPAGSINVYKSHPVWGKFKHITDVSAVSDIEVDDSKNGLWFDLDGHVFNQKPAESGVYIHNHQKVRVK